MRKTARIHIGQGLSLKIAVSNAKRTVLINGAVKHALLAHPGQTIGCALSRTAIASEDNFPHPVYLAAFTQSSALIVDKLDAGGMPIHAVRYSHSYGDIVSMNDKGTLKKNPRLAERQFKLRPPNVKKYSTGGNAGPSAGIRRSNRPTVPVGALRRAMEAGLISPAVVEQLQRKSKKSRAAMTIPASGSAQVSA